MLKGGRTCVASFLMDGAQGVKGANIFMMKRFSNVRRRKEDSVVDYSKGAGVSKAMTADSHTSTKMG